MHLLFPVLDLTVLCSFDESTRYSTLLASHPEGKAKISRLMDQLPAYLPSAAKFALTVALGCAYILKPILDFINVMSPRSPVLDAAVAVVLVTLPVTYLMGVILVYIHVTPPAAAPAQGAARRFADLACALAFALLVALAAFLFLSVDGSPPGGLIPTLDFGNPS